MTRKALGRGLGALIGEEVDREQNFAEVDIDLISPNPHQPRHVFQNDKLAELANSIRASGVLQPIVVRRLLGRFEIVAGERRWRAAQLAGLQKIPAVIREFPEDKLLESSLIENVQREDLNPIEQAKAYQNILERQRITQDQMAQRIGKDRSSVTNYLRLLKLPEEVQNLVEQGQISMGHARSILGLNDPGQQSIAAKEIAIRGLSVRAAERLVTQLKREKVALTPSPAANKRETDPNLKAAEERLRRRFSTIVRIVPGSRGGKIEIEFLSAEDLSRIFDLLISKAP